MNDEIIWDVPQPPPKDWYVRHKAGGALQDPEAAKRSAIDDIQDKEYSALLLKEAHEVNDAFSLALHVPDYYGLINSMYNLTKDYTGNALV